MKNTNHSTSINTDRNINVSQEDLENYLLIDKLRLFQTDFNLQIDKLIQLYETRGRIAIESIIGKG